MTDIAGVSAQALSDAIGAIYDCALEPDHWPKAMQRITELTASAAIGMGVIDHKHKVRLYDYGYNEGDMRIYFEKVCSDESSVRCSPHVPDRETGYRRSAR